MNRLDELRRFADPAALGLEIAPYFNPAVPRAQGYRVMILDVFDTERLRRNAAADPMIPPGGEARIEAVDIVADASGLGAEVEARGLAGRFDYILSSHNFEHLPDPVRFLQGCAAALRPGGVLSMAIPDYRACFDHFRMPTRLSDWLAAYHRGDRQPRPETLFDYDANIAMFTGLGGRPQTACDIARDDAGRFAPQRELRRAHEAWLAATSAPGDYRDAHCSTLFGFSFELMLRDLVHLGLVDLEVVEVTPTRGHEFFAHLRRPMDEGACREPDEAFYARRNRLMREVDAGLGLAGFRNAAGPLRWHWRQIARTLPGAALRERLRAWNRARRERRKLRAS